MWLTPEEPLPSAASTACPADLISSLSLWTPLNVEQMHGRKDLDQPSLTLNVVGISRRALELPKGPSSLELKTSKKSCSWLSPSTLWPLLWKGACVHTASHLLTCSSVDQILVSLNLEVGTVTH